jgi:hypothetical protein
VPLSRTAGSPVRLGALQLIPGSGDTPPRGRVAQPAILGLPVDVFTPASAADCESESALNAARHLRVVLQ